MSLLPTQDETMLAESARGFLDDAAPVARLRGLRDAGHTHDPALWADICAMGWSGVLVPQKQGGSDMGHAAAAVLAREMGKTLVSSPFLSTAVIAATALRRSSDCRAQKALGRIAKGDVTYAIAVDEGPKHAPEATELRAMPKGNGFHLTGRKRLVVDAGFADRALVLARSSAGLTLFDIPLDRQGVTRAQKPMIDARDACDLTFDDVVATGEDVVGHVDDAMAVLTPALRAGQAALAAEMIGLAGGAFAMTVGYLQERKQFGVPIGAFQALQHRAAHLWSEIEITSSAILNAGRVLDSEDDAALAVSLAKARATKTAELAVQEGVQMHGGIGMTDAHDIGFYMRRARVSAEWLGDYNYHAQVVARLRGF